MKSLSDDLERIRQQERELQLPHFNEDTAWQMGVRLRDLARVRQLALVIDIHRHGQPLFYCALAGTKPDNANWVRRKRNVVERFHRSSYRVRLELEQDHASLAEKFGLAGADYTAHGGSFPLTVAGAGVIGSVTVSGLPDRLDHELVVEALCDHLGKDYGSLALAKTTE